MSVVDVDSVAALHQRVLTDLASPGDWWDAVERRSIMEEARGHSSDHSLPAAAVEVIRRVVDESGGLTRDWADAQIAELGEGPYAEIVGVVAMVVALDVYARAIGAEPLALLPPVAGAAAGERPDDVGDVGAWVAMTEVKLLANVTRALSLVPRTNATWRALVTESYSRGPQMLELTWDRALTRPQIELIAAEISKLQECFY